MDLDKIEGLVKIIEKSSLTEFSYKDGEVKIKMSKLDNPPVIAQGIMPQSSANIDATVNSEATEEDEDALFITSPIVGTFYSAQGPDIPAFVKVGDHVKAGQTVCILEAMKLMNEIQSDFDCSIEAILVSNEQKVEYGQPLFRVKRI